MGRQVDAAAAAHRAGVPDRGSSCHASVSSARARAVRRDRSSSAACRWSPSTCISVPPDCQPAQRSTVGAYVARARREPGRHAAARSPTRASRPGGRRAAGRAGRRPRVHPAPRRPPRPRKPAATRAADELRDRGLGRVGGERDAAPASAGAAHRACAAATTVRAAVLVGGEVAGTAGDLDVDRRRRRTRTTSMLLVRRIEPGARSGVAVAGRCGPTPSVAVTTKCSSAHDERMRGRNRTRSPRCPPRSRAGRRRRRLELLRRDLLRSGPRALRVRVVVAPHQRLDAGDPAVVDRDRVVHERGVGLAADQLARLQRQLRLRERAVVLVDRVGLGHDPAEPRGAGLHGDDRAGPGSGRARRRRRA